MQGRLKRWRCLTSNTELLQVRQGPTLKASKDGDISWIRIEHPCEEKGGADAEEYFDTDSLESSVQMADRSLMMSVVYLVGVLCICNTCVNVNAYLMFVCVYLFVMYRSLMMSVVYLVGVLCICNLHVCIYF